MPHTVNRSVLKLVDPNILGRRDGRHVRDRGLASYLEFLTGDLEANIKHTERWTDSEVTLRIGRNGILGHARVLTGLPASSVAVTLAFHYVLYKSFRSLEGGQLCVWYSEEHGGRFMAATEIGNSGAAKLTFNKTNPGFPYVLHLAHSIVAQTAAEELFQARQRKTSPPKLRSVRDA